MIKGTFHCHTDFSDGKNTIREMLDKAVELGFSHIGITDHLIINEYIIDNTVINSVPYYAKHKMYLNSFGEETKSLLENHMKNIKETAKDYPNLKVICGFEVDYCNYIGWEEKFRKLISVLDIGYLILGEHNFFDARNNKIFEANSLDSYSGDDENLQKELIDEYFNCFKNGVNSGLFDFVAHLDYFGFNPNKKYTTKILMPYYIDLLNTISEKGIAIELNSRRNDDQTTWIPSRELLEIAKDLNIPIVVNDDCHDAQTLGFGIKKATKYLHNMNYINFWKPK